MKYYSSEMQKIVYEEFGDELDEKDREIKERDDKINAQDKELKKSQDTINAQDREIKKTKDENIELKKGFEQLNELKNLTPEAKKIISSMLLL